MDYLKSLKKIWFYTPSDSCASSILDVVGCYNGLFFTIEFKRDEEELPRIGQRITLAKIGKANGARLVAWNLLDIKNFMEDLYVKSMGR